MSNCTLGTDSLSNNTTGSNNIAIGTSAGQEITTGSNNILIGECDGNGLGNTDDVILIKNSANSYTNNKSPEGTSTYYYVLCDGSGRLYFSSNFA